MFLCDLPQCDRNMLCSCLDANNKWRELGIKFGFDNLAMNKIERLASTSSVKSPAYYLLAEWETHGDGKISTLFGYMYFMHDSQAMKILRPFVDEQLHHLIKEEGYFSSKDQHSPLSPYNSSKTTTQNPIEVGTTSNPHHQRRSGLGSGNTSTRMNRSLTQSAQVCSFQIPYEELKQGTNNWNKSMVLGQGGFGKVFKGSWKNTEVAIKQLKSKRSNDHLNHEDVIHEIQNSLRNELKYLTKYRHDNILPLYGYSIDEGTPCLVYQFMSNGSLEDQLQLRRNLEALSWWTRLTIARGSARGLQFLHSVDDALIHGDIKSANILLDSNFVPKVGDFGIARDGPIKDYTHVELTTIHGTQFYIPAEVLRGKKLSVKADTYAFGVVLCELATGSLAGVCDKNKTVFHLRDICHNTAAENSLSSLKDLKAGKRNEELYDDLIKLGIKCTSQIPRDRPLMADVLAELDIIVKLRGRGPNTLSQACEPIHAGSTVDFTESDPAIYTC